MNFEIHEFVQNGVINYLYFSSPTKTRKNNNNNNSNSNSNSNNNNNNTQAANKPRSLTKENHPLSAGPSVNFSSGTSRGGE